jgi:hypothetical protein
MSQPPVNPPVGRVVISLHRLYVEIEQEASYPDQLTDLTNRAKELLATSIVVAKDQGIDIRSVDFCDCEVDAGDDDDDDDDV